MLPHSSLHIKTLLVRWIELDMFCHTCHSSEGLLVLSEGQAVIWHLPHFPGFVFVLIIRVSPIQLQKWMFVCFWISFPSLSYDFIFFLESFLNLWVRVRVGLSSPLSSSSSFCSLPFVLFRTSLEREDPKVFTWWRKRASPSPTKMLSYSSRTFKSHSGVEPYVQLVLGEYLACLNQSRLNLTLCKYSV